MFFEHANLIIVKSAFYNEHCRHTLECYESSRLRQNFNLSLAKRIERNIKYDNVSNITNRSIGQDPSIYDIYIYVASCYYGILR